jgi:hypothetical protein
VFNEIIAGTSQRILQIAFGVDRGFLDGDSLPHKSQEGVFGTHGKETAVAIGQKARHGLAGITKVQLAFDGAKFNIKRRELFSKNLYTKCEWENEYIVATYILIIILIPTSA